MLRIRKGCKVDSVLPAPQDLKRTHTGARSARSAIGLSDVLCRVL